MATTMSALMVDDRLRHAYGDGLVVCAIAAAIGIGMLRRYDAAGRWQQQWISWRGALDDSNSNECVDGDGNVDVLLASMVMAILMLAGAGDEVH